MLSIGDLARHTRISVRMLRHYDALGLVVPEHVDPHTGHRWYAVSQIWRVDSLIALKELGFTLEQCGVLLDEQLPVEELRGMLRLRHAQLEQRMTADADRLTEVERRLRSIERGLTMTNGTLTLGPLPAIRLLHLQTEVNDESEIGGAVDALSTELDALQLTGQRVHTYFGGPDKIEVSVGVAVAATATASDGLTLTDVPAVPEGATVTYRGPAEGIGDTWRTLDVALDEQGLESYGIYRDIRLDTSDPDEVVVELQAAVRPAGSC
ncbi:MerR family transcriptional regulator [Kribbella sandramycini]|uniref:DNA-binding transcriptional MerR regulator n=1 Tax=Kribbella sandramycini TaxID=60450 RepID=A0A7Y4L639_9ACTN|nr:helix-turn-helix domain-containing protein [Kribbella sandramycini]MBB6570735.1 DNA-binding transcriptional MerR regulator [Kribbella sandramycini]NOL43876.1 MerR family transcriptional regulator [Kribbella sandramycini]